MGIKQKFNRVKKKFAFLRWLDPFTYVDILLRRFCPVKEKKTLGQEIVYNIVYLVSAFLFAFAIYSLLGFALNTKAPIVVVVGKSMENTFFEGDLLILQGAKPEKMNALIVKTNYDTLEQTPLHLFSKMNYELNSEGLLQVKSISIEGKEIFPDKNNDIVVYFSEYRNQPVIHRIFAVLQAKDGYYVITKGDNKYLNRFIDQDCGKVFLNKAERPCIALYPAKENQLDGKVIFVVPKIGLIKLFLFDYIPSFFAGK